MSYAAIPTVYGGHTFRSRLEATWAAFFDAFGWRWRYEPVDLNGYIPDFTVDSIYGPMLVEVKPIDFEAPNREMLREAGRKMNAAIVGTEFDGRPALFLGRGPCDIGGNYCIGLMNSPWAVEGAAPTASRGLCSTALEVGGLTPTWDHIRDPLDLWTTADLSSRILLDDLWGYASDATAYKGPATQ